MVDMTTDDGSKCLAGTVSDREQHRDDEILQAGPCTLAITLFQDHFENSVFKSLRRDAA